MVMGRRAGRLLVGAAVVLLTAGCSSAVSGTAVKVGGAAVVEPTTDPVVEGPNGPKAGAPDPNLTVTDDAGTSFDELAEKTLADNYAFYEEVFPGEFDQQFTPATELISYDSATGGEACGIDLQDRVNASYIGNCDTIIWDRGEMLPMIDKQVGDLGVATILAHEVGHLVQARLDAPRTSVLLLEQQADCYAGAYWRWVADGNSEYFDLNQTQGIRDVLTAMTWVGDPIGLTADNDRAHGSGFDRTYAASLGFTDGVKRCDEITEDEVRDRIKQTGFTVIPENFSNIEITDTFIQAVADTINVYFTERIPGYQAPTLQTYEGETPPACEGATPQFPVGYCPSSNTVSYNLAELQRLGTPTAGWASTNGDFSAIIALATRYALAAQAVGGVPVTGDTTGLRALCYAGAWASWMKAPQGPQKLSLSPNDLNKAVYAVLTTPGPASDVNGATSTDVIDQVQALHVGVVNDINQCYAFYS